jgi:hypothetical protein
MVVAMSSSRSSLWNGGAVKWRNSSELLETKTFGTDDAVQYIA